MSFPDTAETAAGAGEGQVLAGRYELLGLLGTGGMGSVYRARDRELDEVVALKMLRRDVVELPGILDRFRREAKLARKVTHTNIARTFDIGEHEGAKFLTMEYVDGESLGRIVERDGPLPLGRVLDLVAPLCAGLSAAHAAGIVHRDLKPDNVMIATDGRVVVTDFGIARAVAPDVQHTAGAFVGTPMYMAPEQVEGAPDIDARADVYALGAMLYELLTGAAPWEGESAFAIASRRLLAPPPDPRRHMPELPDAVASAVMKCMARRREDRFASAAEIAAALASVTHPAGFSIAPPSQARAADAEGHEKRVAVLPFRNAGPAEDDYLADGLTEDLIDTLSMNRLLRVRSRGAVMRWRGVEADPRTIGRELDVAVVADGSVRRIGDQLRVTVKLVSVEDGFQLWAKRFDRPAAQILAVGDEAAQAIAEAVTVDWRAPERAALTNPAALDLFLRGRHEFAKRLGESTARALDLFDQALTHAPDDATILAHKAMALARSQVFGRDGTSNIRAAREAAEKALARDPSLGAPHLALATIELYTGSAAAAIRYARRAVALTPMLAEAHELYGRTLAEIGETGRALEHLRAAQGLDPRFEQIGVEIGRVLELAGDREGAEALLARPPVDPNMRGQYWITRARVLMWRKDSAGARTALAIVENDPFDLRRQATDALQIVAAGAPSPEIVTRLETQFLGARTARRRAFFAQLRTEIRAFVGDSAGAAEALRDAADSGLFDLHWIDGCALFDPMRGDTAFLAAREIVHRRAKEILAALAEP